MSCGCDSPGINPSSGTKVKVDSSDTTAGFLTSKLAAGSNITFTVLNVGGNEQLQLAVTAGALDHKVAVSATDTTPNFLFQKLAAGAAIALTVLNGGANEQVSVAVSGADLTNLSQFGSSPSANQFLKGNGPGLANSWANLFASPANPGDNGKVAVAQSGDFIYQLLSNANVDPAAAIAGTKISPDFGAQTVTTTGILASNSATAQLRLGLTTTGIGHAATTGTIRLFNNFTIFARNAADSADVQIANLNGSNVLTIGDGTNNGTALLNASTFSQLATGGTVRFQVGTTGITVSLPIAAYNADAFTWGASQTPSISQTSSANDGKTFSIVAQASSGANKAGGRLFLAGGDSTNGTPGVKSGVQIAIANGSVDTMVHSLQITTTQNVLGLVSQTQMSNVRMPANTGNFVVFVGDAGTNPSADAGTGHIYYSDSAKPAWRFNGTNFRLNGTSNVANTTVGGLTLPALAAGYMDVQINGTQQKIPYYTA